jgi:folate-dependent phosphoribosylglycinamide formyltransferase PurN
MKKWVALFSNSGKELAEVIEKTGSVPDEILCDKVRTQWDQRLHNVTLLDHETIIDWLGNQEADTLITLHGYWRILPASKIEAKIYNVHPGDIFKYPELVGIHPQKKAIELNLPSTGVLIHEVDDSVDGGEPQFFADYNIKEGSTVESLTEELRHEAVKLWQIFLLTNLK